MTSPSSSSPPCCSYWRLWLWVSAVLRRPAASGSGRVVVSSSRLKTTKSDKHETAIKPVQTRALIIQIVEKNSEIFYTFTSILYLLFPSGWWLHILCRRQDISTFYLRASEITWNIFWLDNSLMTTHRIWDLDFSWGCIVWKYCHWTLRNILAALKSVEKSDFITSPCTSQNIDPWDNSMIVNSFLGGDVKNGTNKIGSMGVLALVRHLQTYFTFQFHHPCVSQSSLSKLRTLCDSDIVLNNQCMTIILSYTFLFYTGAAIHCLAW